MSRPAGQPTDQEPLELFEYNLLITHFNKPHWRFCCEILWETGVRIGEALAIKRQDIENHGVWITREKRDDHPRDFIPLSPSLYGRLKAAYPVAYAREPLIFPFTAAAAWLAIKKAAAAAGIRRSIHPHSFRHGFGYRAMKANLPGKTPLEQAGVVQKMLGHVSINSTLVYTKPTQKDIDEAFHRLNNP